MPLRACGGLAFGNNANTGLANALFFVTGSMMRSTDCLEFLHRFTTRKTKTKEKLKELKTRARPLFRYGKFL